MDNDFGTCAKCPFSHPDRICREPDGKAPPFCSTKLYPGVVQEACEEYKNAPGLMDFASEASKQEAACYRPSDINPSRNMPLKCRVEETIEFCKRMDYKKLGLAFCIGLSKEAATLNRILTSHGFDVVSVVCKIGTIDKSFINIGPNERVNRGCPHESMCNPVAQAKVMNEEKVDFVIVLGLCVGHDSMLFKYVEAPVTVLAVKDRLLGHNPMAALYSGYYAFLEKPQQP